MFGCLSKFLLDFSDFVFISIWTFVCLLFMSFGTFLIYVVPLILIYLFSMSLVTFLITCHFIRDLFLSFRFPLGLLHVLFHFGLLFIQFHVGPYLFTVDVLCYLVLLFSSRAAAAAAAATTTRASY